jgi:LIM homeobox protein 2/9
MRTSFKHQQLRIMKAHFLTNQNPDSKELKELSERTGLQKRVLQVGFFSIKNSGVTKTRDH